MFATLLLSTVLAPSMPSVKWEPITATPPEIEFTVTKTDSGYQILSSDGSLTLETNYKPNIEGHWRLSLYGDYWTREVNPERRSNDFGGYASGELVWHEGKLWPFIPDDRPMRRQVMGFSAVGEFVESRSWYDYSTDKIPCEIHFFKSPSQSLSSNRQIFSARVNAVTESGTVIGYGTTKQMDYSDNTVHDFTNGNILIAKNASYGGSSGNTILITNNGANTSRVPGTRSLFRLNENFNWSSIGNLRGEDLDFQKIMPSAQSDTYLTTLKNCFGAYNIWMWDITIKGQKFEMSKIVKDLSLPDYATPIGFREGKLILGSGTYGEPLEVYGYLSIEGVTPGFPSRK